MARQTFRTMDVLRLQIQEAPTGPINLIANPDGALGGFGWITASPDGATVTGDGTDLVYTTGFNGPFDDMRSELAPVTPGFYWSARWVMTQSVGTVEVTRRYHDLDRAEIASASLGAYSASATIRVAAPSLIPAGAAYVSLGFKRTAPSGSGSGSLVKLRRVAMAISATAAPLNFDALEPIQFLDILAPTHSIQIDRAELNLGTLTATILDSDLDPAKSTAIRPGAVVRALARTPATELGEADYGEGPYGGALGDWSPIFTGKARQASVAYDLRTREEDKRARITLVATDALTEMSAIPRDAGVALISELPALIEGAGVPWNVNGSNASVSGETQVSLDPSASLVDQLALTRDSRLGYVWVDRTGTLNAFDNTLVTQTPGSYAGVAALDEADYSDLEIGYDTEALINEVQVNFLRYDGMTGETTEIPYGPYRDAASIREWGAHSQTFRIHALTESAPQIAAYASSILSANSQPRIRPTSLTIPIRRPGNLAKVFLDIFDVQNVSNQISTLSEPVRITGLTHTITTSGWLLTLTFAGLGSVSIPTRNQ